MISIFAGLSLAAQLLRGAGDNGVPVAATGRVEARLKGDHMIKSIKDSKRAVEAGSVFAEGAISLRDAVRGALRRGHYARRTEEAYMHWIFEFVRFHGRRSPRAMGPPEIVAYLNHLAVERHVAASTHNQALCAIVFLYKKVYLRDMEELEGLQRARRPMHLPVVLARDEALRVIDRLDTPCRLIVQLLYGSGLRLNECLSIRIKDIDFERRQITVRRGKGGKDRACLLPDAVRDELKRQVAWVKKRHQAALSAGLGAVDLPNALNEKRPSAAIRFEWQYLFPASRAVFDEKSRCHVLPHLHESAVQRAIGDAASRARVGKRVTSHTFRHSFATELLQANVDIRTIQTLLGHEDVSTTMIYTHIVDRGPLGVRSPLDR